jgi:hypothetical protein
MAEKKHIEKNREPTSSEQESAKIFQFERRAPDARSARKSVRQLCIETCQETYLLLAQTATQLASRKNRPLNSELTLLWDGAQAAHFATEYLIRQSPSALLVASTCAEICDDIADELESKYEEEESPVAAQLLDCAEQARLLADACDGLADAESFESPELAQSLDEAGDIENDDEAQSQVPDEGA